MSNPIPPPVQPGSSMTPVTNPQLSVTINAVYMNTSQEIIVITEDKAQLCLHKHLSAIEGRRDWQTPAAVLLTLGLSLLTADIHDFIFPKAAWQAVYMIAALLVVVWLIVAFFRLVKRHTVEDLITEMKDGSAPPQQAP
jgi:hypothetical protein